MVAGCAVSGSCSGASSTREHPLGGGDPALHQVRHRGHLGQRLGELARVLDERLHVAQAHGSGGDPQPTDHGDDDVVEVPDEHHRRHDDAADELGPEARVVQRVVALGEEPVGLLLAPEHLDELVAGVGLLDHPVHLAGALPLLDEVLLAALADHRGHDHGDRDRHEGEECQQRRDPDHHRDHRDDGEQRGEQLAQRLLQALRHVVDVVGDPAEQLTARLAVEVRQRQPVELVLDVAAQPVDGAVDRDGEHPALDPLQQRGHEVEAEHEEQDLAQRREVDALAGHDVVHRGEHVGEVVLALRPAARPRPGPA